MKALIICLALLFSAAQTYAGQFKTLVDAIGQKQSGWENTNKIKGIKWEWPHYEVGAHEFTMVGATKVGQNKTPNIGVTTVLIEGYRTGFSLITLRAQNSRVKVTMFGESASSKIKTSCDDNSMTNSFEVFKFQNTGAVLVYLSISYSEGASGQAGDAVLSLSTDPKDVMDKGCKLL